jgi:hypothetical protein
VRAGLEAAAPTTAELAASGYMIGSGRLVLSRRVAALVVVRRLRVGRGVRVHGEKRSERFLRIDAVEGDALIVVALHRNTVPRWEAPKKQRPRLSGAFGQLVAAGTVPSNEQHLS